MRDARLWIIPIACLLLQPLDAAERKLTPEERIELIRGLTAEQATAKVLLPRSKKPLIYDSIGSFDEERWDALAKANGPAARPGDLLQITKVSLEDDRIVFEINGGSRSGPRWYERIQVNSGRRTVPIGSGTSSVAPAGTNLALVFPGRLPPLTTAEAKKVLAPVLDFNIRSAAEHYFETLPPETQQAIKDKKATEGMDREQVILALGRPDNKIRETVDGVELEDWIFGKPPGRIIFVTFEGDKVVRVKESYAGLGGSVAPPIPTPR